MQQTKFDRWLKERFVRETHVFCLSEPPWVPPRVVLEPMEVNLRNRFRYRMVIRSRRHLDQALAALKDQNQTFATRVESRAVWYRRFLDDPRGGSVTFRLLWIALVAGGIACAILFFPKGLLQQLGEIFGFFKKYI